MIYITFDFASNKMWLLLVPLKDSNRFNGSIPIALIDLTKLESLLLGKCMWKFGKVETIFVGLLTRLVWNNIMILKCDYLHMFFFIVAQLITVSQAPFLLGWAHWKCYESLHWVRSRTHKVICRMINIFLSRLTEMTFSCLLYFHLF